MFLGAFLVKDHKPTLCPKHMLAIHSFLLCSALYQTWHYWDLVQAAHQVDKHFQATL